MENDDYDAIVQEQSIDELVAAKWPQRTPEIATLRAVVLGADARIREGVKWNAPSFAVADWFATMNLRPKGPLRLVLHTGAKAVPGHPDAAIDDPEGLLTWLGKDRAIVELADETDIEAKRAALTRILQQWVEQLPTT